MKTPTTPLGSGVVVAGVAVAGGGVTFAPGLDLIGVLKVEF